MDPIPPSPWHPDRRWADPLIAFLALITLLVVNFTLHTRQVANDRPSARTSLQGQMLEAALAGPRLLDGAKVGQKEWSRARTQLVEPWDRALLAVLMAELGDPDEARALVAEGSPAGIGGEHFRKAFAAAYGNDPIPDTPSREDVRRRLGNGYTATLLEARLQDREGGPASGAALRAQARTTLLTRLATLGSLGLLVLGLAVGGLVMGIYLWTTRRQRPTRPLPDWGLSGRAATLVFLGWFMAFFAAGNLASLALMPWPALRWAVVPVGTLFHATIGVRLLCWAEGLSFTELWRRLAPGSLRQNLAWGAAFLALAVFLVLTVAMVTSLVMRPDQSPQRDLQELLRGLTGWGPSLAMFAVVAGLAPFFEELLFRGFLFPVMARQGRVTVALFASALLFGVIHLQPAGLPILSTLGLVLALAVRRTGSLWPAILVHACWNGTLFLLMRAFA
ncbi:CPBP family intramembrane glutamic endopeptidase [Geothrix fuzhouensis]|uniref:CPBP family intramembrane glutamic endopeptidase n=1 Tax=Geothrix fuzhouensis TaxID=2966451 RepID=UPI002148E45D|nr:CPBP family intramembrane glutamic endopeptidase [Geothrix fuzhouensis]